eukprot:4247097-Prymnesium_polylepis.1
MLHCWSMCFTVKHALQNRFKLPCSAKFLPGCSAARMSAFQNATLALLLRLSDPTGSLGDYWQGVGCAAVLAVRHFNARNGTVVPSLAAEHGGLRLRELIFDTGSVAAGGISWATVRRSARAVMP